MKFKALFLLTVFLLNNMVGFACALTMDADHHEEPVVQEKHSPLSSAKQNSEQIKPPLQDNPIHDHGSHEHAKPSDPNSQIPVAVNKQIASIASSDDACCQDAVNSFTSLSKLIPQKGSFDIKAPVFDRYILYQLSTLLKLAINEPATVYFVSAKEPPPTLDIRISIQSFLI